MSEAVSVDGRSYFKPFAVGITPPSASTMADSYPDPQARAYALTITGVGQLHRAGLTAVVDHPNASFWSALTVTRFTVI